MTYPQTMNYSEYKTNLHGKIANLDSLPTGLRCKYLVLIAGQNDTLIAKQWKRKLPKLNDNEFLIIL